MFPGPAYEYFTDYELRARLSAFAREARLGALALSAPHVHSSVERIPGRVLGAAFGRLRALRRPLTLFRRDHVAPVAASVQTPNQFTAGKQEGIMQYAAAAAADTGALRDYAARILRGETPPPPIARTLGFTIISLAEGEAVVRYEVDLARYANPMGTLHGGIVCDLADLAMGIVYGGTLGDGETFTTVELTMNFLRPVFGGTLTATAHLVHGGRSLGLVECDVADERGRLVARAKSTCMTLRGSQAAGRTLQSAVEQAA